MNTECRREAVRDIKGQQEAELNFVAVFDSFWSLFLVVFSLFSCFESLLTPESFCSYFDLFCFSFSFFLAFFGAMIAEH